MDSQSEKTGVRPRSLHCAQSTTRARACLRDIRSFAPNLEVAESQQRVAVWESLGLRV